MLCVIMCFVRVRYAVVGCLSAFVVVCVFLLLHFRDFVLLFCCFVCACLGFCRLCPKRCSVFFKYRFRFQMPSWFKAC